MPFLPCRLRRPVTALFAGVLAPLVLTACSNGPGEDDVAAAEALVEQGISQLVNGTNDTAEETFARVLRFDPEQALAHYNLGVIDQRANRDAHAIDHYEDALDLDPDHGPSLYNLAMLTEHNDLDEAVKLYQSAKEVQPDHAPTYMRLGFALNHLGRTAEAEEMLSRGIALDPTMELVQAPSYE